MCINAVNRLTSTTLWRLWDCLCLCLSMTHTNTSVLFMWHYTHQDRHSHSLNMLLSSLSHWLSTAAAALPLATQSIISLSTRAAVAVRWVVVQQRSGHQTSLSTLHHTHYHAWKHNNYQFCKLIRPVLSSWEPPSRPRPSTTVKDNRQGQGQVLSSLEPPSRPRSRLRTIIIGTTIKAKAKAKAKVKAKDYHHWNHHQG